MSKQESNIETMYKAVRNFQTLGTGRDYRKVIVGDSDDARTASLSFEGNVYQNWPSWRQVTIKTGDNLKTFDTATHTLNGKAAYIFFWNELTADLWFQQVEREKILEYCKSAEPKDAVGMEELIVEETGAEYRVCVHPAWAAMNLKRIEMEVRRLSLRSLRKLNSLILDGSLCPVAPTKAA